MYPPLRYMVLLLDMPGFVSKLQDHISENVHILRKGNFDLG